MKEDREPSTPLCAASLLLTLISAAHPGDSSLHLHPSLAVHNCECAERARLRCMGQRVEGSMRLPLQDKQAPNLHKDLAGLIQKYSQWLDHFQTCFLSRIFFFFICSQLQFSYRCSILNCWTLLRLDAWTFLNEAVSLCFLHFLPPAQCTQNPFHFIDVFCRRLSSNYFPALCLLLLSLLQKASLWLPGRHSARRR